MRRQPGITPRQRRVLRLLATGMSYSEAASALGISPVTVAQQASAAYLRLGAYSLIEALIALGWLNVPPEDVS